VKVGDLVRWGSGPKWTEEDIQKYCTIGLVMCIFEVNDKVLVQWCSHGRDDLNSYRARDLEVISESR